MRARLHTALNTFAGYPRTRPLRASDRVTCAGPGAGRRSRRGRERRSGSGSGCSRDRACLAELRDQISRGTRSADTTGTRRDELTAEHQLRTEMPSDQTAAENKLRTQWLVEQQLAEQ